MKLKLDIDYDYDFDLLGISSGEKSYFIAWAIGQALNIDFTKKKNIALYLKNDASLDIHNYAYNSDFNVVRIFENKAEKKIKEIETQTAPSLFDDNTNTVNYFLPELKQFEYLIQFEGAIRNLSIEEVFVKINSIREIQLVKHIDLDNIKSKQNLIFE